MNISNARKSVSPGSQLTTHIGPKKLIGEIKWFGGINGQTGRKNDYGFISTLEGDLYFHRTFSTSPLELLIPGAKVVFLRIKGRDGRPAAASVRVLTDMSDGERVALLREIENISPEYVIAIVLSRDVIPPCENEALRALSSLLALRPAPDIIQQFWEKFPPTDPKFFPFAPMSVKAKVLSEMNDDQRVALLKKSENFTAEDVLAIVLSRDLVPPCENEAFSAISVLSALNPEPSIIQSFWKKFPPVDPKNLFFSIAPTSVKIKALSGLPDNERISLVKGEGKLSAEDMLAILLSRDVLSPCEEEAFHAISALSALKFASNDIQRFWRKFPPTSPKDVFFPIAPDTIKTEVCRKHYSILLFKLSKLFYSISEIQTSIEAKEVYLSLDKRDEEIAKSWAKSKYDGVLAKMLSARAAEKAVQMLYQGMGLQVEDISIKQLDGQSEDWLTHDLLVDGTIAVDVKNARRPVNGKKFYVEHTVPRFKTDRNNSGVKIAGILSPYLNLRYIKNPNEVNFNIDKLIFLGETTRDSIERLIVNFNSPTFEVIRNYERTFPHWLFGYPQAWYQKFSTSIKQLTDGCEWPRDMEWEYLLDDSEKMKIIPALCVTGKPLPSVVSSRLSSWQIDFYSKIQRLEDALPKLPAIFLSILTDFLDRLKENQADFSPKDYLPLLYAENINSSIPHPLGAIDPLGIVQGLVNTLTILWDGRDKANLKKLSNFRFIGMGILQGREKESRKWKTIIAYCGGAIYETDESGAVILTPDGEPLLEKGKCGHSPLIIGDNRTCLACGKLVCSQCGFCSLPCQEKLFREMAVAKRSKNRRFQSDQTPIREREEAKEPPWEEVPLEVYESYFWKR
ncbi:hypothetical protein [Azohydromonas australica]|uniref:hypothetical protein n=1 Tax=Azohydromonas australica TaxID=364039 RepID=UPI0003FEFED2|nr:hypothetical protein [Azohydromonas australica]